MLQLEPPSLVSMVVQSGVEQGESLLAEKSNARVVSRQRAQTYAALDETNATNSRTHYYYYYVLASAVD